MNTKKFNIDYNDIETEIYMIEDKDTLVSIPDLFLSFKLEERDEMEIVSYLFSVMDESDAELFADRILKELGEHNGI
ncbi:YueH family protein [Phocicoccus schoeneichii]|uniref:Uncharacterized protein n=1 Tax=Phocicoccus schoeneichii TaxID=1812261 RepID=A0A6V7R7H0_9BACL|nr:YueH family protein [Jeotgalicoccus schoeneichii]CAD2072964.1 hypothetical protein JEOSCH030_00512 [Jeotgalicoccus schoeneichii]